MFIKSMLILHVCLLSCVAFIVSRIDSVSVAWLSVVDNGLY